MITATLCSGVCLVTTCANCSVFKTHLLGLSQTVTTTHGSLLLSNDSNGTQLNFTVSSNCHSSLQVSPQWSSQLLLFSFVYCFLEGTVQDITIRLKGSSRFFNSVHLSMNQKKETLCNSFALDAPTVWNDLPDEVPFAPTLTCFRKRLKLYPFKKGIPNLAFTLSGVSVVLDYGQMIFELDFVLAP